MVIAIVLLAILFLVGFANTLFHIPPKKLLVHLQSLFYIIFPSTCSSSSSIMTTKARSTEYSKEEQSIKKKDLSTRYVELERVFATFDKNGDGFITRQELGESLRNIGIFSSDKDIESMIEKLDINGDGLIDIQEFEEMYASMGGLGEDVKEEDEEVELRDAFGVFDGNNDGLITVEELVYVLNSLGIKKGIKDEDCREMIKNVDMDGDGMVNFDEFKHMMKNGGKLISVA